MSSNRFIALSFALIAASSARGEFALRDRDTVVFLGDSITAARQYSKIIEVYTLLRFPERNIRFVNAGKGGETAKLSLDRVESAVFAEGATVVTVAYGVNDIGWGMKADTAHKEEYLSAIGELIDRCQKRGVRVFICSAAITAEDPDKAENGFLQKMCDEGLALAKSKDAGSIDVQRGMRAVQRRIMERNAREPDKKKQTRLHADDGVHLNELGQMAMAFAILKGLGAPADVSSASIDAVAKKAISSAGCNVSAIKNAHGGLAFTRADDQLPLNLQPLWMLNGMHIPFSDELNRYMLAITNLAPGRYEIAAGGRPLGTWSAETLARGINIASATADPWVPGGPWDGQAHAVKTLTDMRDEIVFTRRGMNSNLMAHPHLLKLLNEADAIEARLAAFQKELATPIPIDFTVRRTAAEAR